MAVRSLLIAEQLSQWHGLRECPRGYLGQQKIRSDEVDPFAEKFTELTTQPDQGQRAVCPDVEINAQVYVAVWPILAAGDRASYRATAGCDVPARRASSA